MSKLIVTNIHYSVFFPPNQHIGYVFIVSLNVSTHYQHLVFFYKRATMHCKWRVIYRPIFILSLLAVRDTYRTSQISYSAPPGGIGGVSTSVAFWPFRHKCLQTITTYLHHMFHFDRIKIHLLKFFCGLKLFTYYWNHMSICT